MANYETQIVVIAAGPSGLSAAVQAAEDGAEVIVLEKAAAVGGAANMGMGPLGIGTKYQKQQMEDITVEKAFNMFMEYTHYNVDARLVKRYFEQSGETIEWLEVDCNRRNLHLDWFDREIKDQRSKIKDHLPPPLQNWRSRPWLAAPTASGARTRQIDTRGPVSKSWGRSSDKV